MRRHHVAMILLGLVPACVSLAGLTGGDAGHDAGSDVACAGGATVCKGVQPQICVSGTWIDNGGPCAGDGPACLDGSCVSCTPRATRCSGNGVETCTDVGAWSGAVACEAGATCISGVCGGVCGPGQTLCSGNAVQTCDAEGQWGPAAACREDTTCISGVCGGACAPGQVQCSGNTPQTCGANGVWEDGTACVGSGLRPFCALGSCMAQPPSCNTSATQGINDCNGESCCTSLEVVGNTGDAGTTFYRTYDVTEAGTTIVVAADASINRSAPATVSSFRLDKYLVTVGRFRQFVNLLYPNGQPMDAGSLAWIPPLGSGKHTHLNGGKGLVSVGGGEAGVGYEAGWSPGYDLLVSPTNASLACDSTSTWTSLPGTSENLPINCITWPEAYAFCIWDGGFLASEAEWVYAAAGGSQQREYPWGFVDAGSENLYAIYDCDYPSRSGPPCKGGVGNIAPVGEATKGVGRWGQLDLAGDLYEWALDFLGPLVTPCTDCAYFASSESRVLRGNGYSSTFNSYLNHKGVTPEARSSANGFRCARTP